MASLPSIPGLCQPLPRKPSTALKGWDGYVVGGLAQPLILDSAWERTLLGRVVMWSKLLIGITLDLCCTDVMDVIVCAQGIQFGGNTVYYITWPSRPGLAWSSLTRCEQSYRPVGYHATCSTPLGLWPNVSVGLPTLCLLISC